MGFVCDTCATALKLLRKQPVATFSHNLEIPSFQLKPLELIMYVGFSIVQGISRSLSLHKFESAAYVSKPNMH